MIVVSDTSPISALIRLNLIELLPKVFGSVIIPPAVRDELKYLGKQGYNLSSFWEADWIEVQRPNDIDLIYKLSLELDVGEVEAIALANELSPRFLFFDEKKGRKVAERLGIPIVGLLGILLLAKKAGHLDKIRPIVLQLKSIGFFVSTNIVNRVLERVDEQPI